MYYLVHFSFSSSFSKATVAKEWKEAIFCYRINFDTSIPGFFASWGIFYFPEILNQVIPVFTGLITCLSSEFKLPFQQSSSVSVSNSVHRCTPAIASSFQASMHEISSNTNKVIVFSDPILCSFSSCPYDVFCFSMLVGKQGLTLDSELYCITGICYLSMENRVSPQRAKGSFENPVKCINNELGIKSKPCLDVSIESCHTTIASGGSWLKMYLHIKTDRDGFRQFKCSFSADESNRGWRGKHRLPLPSHMAVVSSNACYIIFISCSDISQKAKRNPNLQL